MTVDLSQYVGKNVICVLSDGETLTGIVEKRKNNATHPYQVDYWCFTRDGKGYSKPNIVSIHPNVEFKGEAQRYPNIDLSKFEGQTVYVKFKSGATREAKLTKENNHWLLEGIVRSNKDGTLPNSYVEDKWTIEEIYGEGAYQMMLKPIPEEVVDPAVERAKEAVKDLSEEQIAKLLKSLKS